MVNITIQYCEIKQKKKTHLLQGVEPGYVV